MSDQATLTDRDAIIAAVRAAQQAANLAEQAQNLEARRGERINRTFHIGQMVYSWRGGHEGWAVIDDYDPDLGDIGVRWCDRHGDLYPGGAWVLPNCLSTRRTPCAMSACERSNGHPPGHFIDGKLVMGDG